MDQTPRIVIKLGEESALVYVSIGEDEYALDGDTARAMGEALFKTGCDSQALAAKKQP